MDTDSEGSYSEMLQDLGSSEWGSALRAVGNADAWIQAAAPGDLRVDKLVALIAELAGHQKWEIRRAVALSAGRAPHDGFEAAVSKLATDENGRVRQAAAYAVLRRRDWRYASTLGKEHEQRINAVLDDIEGRHGLRGRQAARRVGEEIANTFARELYHEVIKLLSPLAMTADRLKVKIADNAVPRSDIAIEATRVDAQINRLRSVLDAMRAFTNLPKLTFSGESLLSVVREAGDIAVGRLSASRYPAIQVSIDPALAIEIDRTRMVQAFTNVLVNAVEAYEGLSTLTPVVVRAEVRDGTAFISIRDHGCGMSTEAVSDARGLFVTSKANGTGFGLPLAIKIIETEHCGRLTLVSESGSGTEVLVALPLHQRVSHT